MKRGPGFPPEVKRLAVETYLAGKATMPDLAAELGVNAATISRWVANARARGVVAPPAGAIITTLPGGCTTVARNGVSYSQCGTTYYQRVSSGYQVVVF